MTTRFISGGNIYGGTLGSAYARLFLPLNGRLRFASARNFTTGGQRVMILLTDRSFVPTPQNDTYGDVLPLIGQAQGGTQDPVCWSGDSGPLDQSLQQLLAVFFNVSPGDRLLLMAGVEYV